MILSLILRLSVLNNNAPFGVTTVFSALTLFINAFDLPVAISQNLSA
jgi:hypothetical protein